MQEDCSNDRQSCINSYCVANNYTCWNGYFCSSLYGNSISGSKDFIAMECSSDVNCSAFRYSPSNGYGFKCKNSFPINAEDSGYQKDDWELCTFDLTTCCQSISVIESGEVESKQSWNMGNFLFNKIGLNGRPIYKNSKEQYLYLGDNGIWSIGLDSKSTIAGIYHQSCVEECPNQCSNRWKYLDIIGDGSINVNSSIKVSCVERRICMADSDCNHQNCEYCLSDGHCSAFNSEYCDYFPCGVGDGDCDSGTCPSGLFCGKNNFLEYHPLLSHCFSGKTNNADVCIKKGI